MIDLQPACDRMIDLLAALTDDQLAASTPCREYTVGDLVDHVDLVCRGGTALALRDIGAMEAATRSPDAGQLDPEWRERIVHHVRMVGEAWADPAAWLGTGDVPGSDLSNERWGLITLTELVVHGWDLARAVGQPFDLPEPTLHACLDHVAEFVPNAPVPSLWGEAVEVGPDATILDRIVAITGRVP